MESQKTCPRCGAAFNCGMNNPEVACWCADLPPLAALHPASDCYCPACLKQLLEDQQASAASS